MCKTTKPREYGKFEHGSRTIGEGGDLDTAPNSMLLSLQLNLAAGKISIGSTGIPFKYAMTGIIINRCNNK